MNSSLILETLAAVDREVLIGLPFVRQEQRALWKSNPGVSSRVIATVLCQRFPSETAALFAKAKAASEADAQRRSLAAAARPAHAAHGAERAKQQDDLDQAFQIGDYAPGNIGRVTHRGNVQVFGRAR